MKSASTVILLLALAVPGLLENVGRSSRWLGANLVVSVEKPSEAFEVFKRAGFRGGVLVSLSGNPYFKAYTSEAVIPPLESLPVPVFDIGRKVEDILEDKNFLLVMVESGIARKIIHILPDHVFGKKFQQPLSMPITSYYFTSPRLISSSSGKPDLSKIDTPMVYIDASYFRTESPLKALEVLSGIGRTAALVACPLEHDPSVSSRERESLEEFLELVREKYRRI
jgi:hypothetical protein